MPSANRLELTGAPGSPYSLKVRSYLRYKDIGFEWVPRTSKTDADIQAHARVPTVPLLLFPNRPASQDSTAMLAALEADHAAPASTPDDPARNSPNSPGAMPPPRGSGFA